jgi:histidinol dehydrogenase
MDRTLYSLYIRRFYIDGIENAGSVFYINYTPESAGLCVWNKSYLPTNGYAKGVNLDSFTNQ